jgi:hypothetical protein
VALKKGAHARLPQAGGTGGSTILVSATICRPQRLLQ